MKKMISLRAEAVKLTWWHVQTALWPICQTQCDGTTAPLPVSFQSPRWRYIIILLPRNNRASWTLSQVYGSVKGISHWKKGQLQCRGSHQNEAMHYWVHDVLVENRIWAKSQNLSSSLKGVHKDNLLQPGIQTIEKAEAKSQRQC